jgi:hypothetical protein
MQQQYWKQKQHMQTVSTIQQDNKPHISMPSIGKIRIKQHHRVCVQLCFNICKERGLKLDKEHWYKHAPQSVQIGYESKVNILWNQQVKNDTAIANNKLDITIHDNEKGTFMLTRQNKVRRQKRNQARC